MKFEILDGKKCMIFFNHLVNEIPTHMYIPYTVKPVLCDIPAIEGAVLFELGLCASGKKLIKNAI